MASFKPRSSLYDPLRQIWVAATPEEIVRQSLLHVMIHQLGYPRSLFAVEKQLSELPHLHMQGDLPVRRVDVVCYHRIGEQMRPLLLIECKETLPGAEAKRQALGYNHYVKASFVAVAGPGHVEVIDPQSVPFLPTFFQLEGALCK